MRGAKAKREREKGCGGGGYQADEERPSGKEEAAAEKEEVSIVAAISVGTSQTLEVFNSCGAMLISVSLGPSASSRNGRMWSALNLDIPLVYVWEA